MNPEQQERMLKLANIILLEIQALKETKNIDCTLAIAEEITRDASELAKAVKSMVEQKKVA